jgi:hypothetical protein
MSRCEVVVSEVRSESKFIWLDKFSYNYPVSVFAKSCLAVLVLVQGHRPAEIVSHSAGLWTSLKMNYLLWNSDCVYLISLDISVCLLSYYFSVCFSLFFTLLSLFKQNKSRLMRSPSCLCVCIPCINFWMSEPIVMKLVILYHGTWAHLNNVLHKWIPSVCVYICILLLLGNGSVKTLPRQRKHRQHYKNCLTRRFLGSPCRIKVK